jgi:hypothetical protein
MQAGLDTLEISKRLRGAGFSESQAEVMTGVLRDAHDADISQLATKSDLAQLEAVVKSEIARIEAQLSQFATKGDVVALRTDVAAIRADMEILRRDLTIRLGSMIVVATGLLLAAKFFA